MYANKQTKIEHAMDQYNDLLGDILGDSFQQEHRQFSASQETALELFKSGKNVLVMGAAGTGKSRIIREMSRITKYRNLVVTATTGIAAYNIGGITLNSFMGIGTGTEPLAVLIQRIKRKFGIRERLRNTDILIIDEISMLSAESFEKINAICQAVRGRNKPFGGIQVVMTGDMFQLLPVFETQNHGQTDRRLLFESDVFRKIFTKSNTVILTQNFRQQDQQFEQLLSRLRRGQQTPEDLSVIQSRLLNNLKPSSQDLESAVHLVSSNKYAQVINSTNLNALHGEIVRYESETFEEGDPEQSKELTRELQSQMSQKGILTIGLKVGARVMLVKNLSVEQGLVNGSVGTIISFQRWNGRAYPVVRFDNGVTEQITPVEWELEFNKINGTENGITNTNSVSRIRQLPLMLSWAITIHRSQSLTLDKAVMDLASCFCDAMVYVALSRVRSISGLYLESFDPKKIIVNTTVLKSLSELETA